MIKQFLTDVVWGERDYLIIDTPPGTSDEHITVVEQLRAIKPDGAILVSTPQVSRQLDDNVHTIVVAITVEILVIHWVDHTLNFFFFFVSLTVSYHSA